MRRFVLAIILLLISVAAISSAAQRRTSTRRADSITGRVINESGQPLTTARISLGEYGRSRTVMRAVTIEEDGSFRAQGLVPGVYAISVYAPGYVYADERVGPKFYRPGDTANFTMIKGGAISGTVTNSAGEPVVAATVRAVRIRDLDGRPARSPAASRPRLTDDRGVYRLYGLRPGLYTVSAGGQSFLGRPTPYGDELPIYYPSDTRDTAAEVMVRGGEDVSGINIRYRNEPGHTISGTVLGPQSSSMMNRGIGVNLSRIAGGISENLAGVSVDPSNGSFIFRGLPDGEYFVTARRSTFGDDAGATSERVRVKVKGANVTGTELRLTPYGSVAGRIIAEPIAADKKKECESMERGSIEENIINLRPERKDPLMELYYLVMLRAAPDDKGEFTINNVESGRYSFSTELLHESLYIRAMTLSKDAQSRSSIDVAREGLAIKAGERLRGVTITVSEGAARLRGRLLPATDGARLPDRLRVHLVPAERESADDLLRYYEAAVEGDDSFTLNNLAPGKYWLLARAYSSENPTGASVTARDQAARAALRSEAASANVAIELQTCRRVNDYTLKYAPPVNRAAPKKNQ